MQGATRHALRQFAPRYLHRSLQLARDVRNHRTEPHRLVHDRVEVVHGRGLGMVGQSQTIRRAAARTTSGCRASSIHRPPKRRGRGLMSRQQQRHHFVAQNGVTDGHSVLVARLEQHREDVVAALVRRRAPPCEFGEQRRCPSLRFRRTTRPHGLRGPRSTRNAESWNRLPKRPAYSANSRAIRSFKRADSADSSRPNTARMITSNVSERIDG